MKTYKLHFIRHGMTLANLEGKFTGTTDVSLCEKGRAELRSLWERCDYPKVDMVYTSPLQRCAETAEILYPDTYCDVLDNLSECDLGDFEGKTMEELKDMPEFEDWIHTGATPPKGESKEDFITRLVLAVNNIFSEMMESQMSNVAIITHGGVIMWLMSSIGLPKRDIHEWRVDNGMGYTVLMTPQMWMRDRAFEVFDVIPKPPLEEPSTF